MPIGRAPFDRFFQIEQCQESTCSQLHRQTGTRKDFTRNISHLDLQDDCTGTSTSFLERLAQAWDSNHKKA